VSHREVPRPGGVRPGWTFRPPRRSAPRARTDRGGLARFAVPGALTIEVTAEAPRRLAQVEVSAASGGAHERRVRLELLPDWDLAVEVVDDALRPVADRIELSTLREGAGYTQGEATDGAGTAVFTHVGYDRSRSRPSTTSTCATSKASNASSCR
jgi:hypothetical protein